MTFTYVAGSGFVTPSSTVSEAVYLDGSPTPIATGSFTVVNDSGGTSTIPISVPSGTHTITADANTVAQGEVVGFPVSATLSCGPPPPPPCTPGSAVNLRWHYSANGSSGSWSGTNTERCGSSFTLNQQDMEGDQKLAPGTTMKVGYDFTVPGNHSSLFFTVSNAQVVFAVACASGATPSQSTFTVTMPTQTYNVTNDQWTPSGDQSSPLVYQGSAPVPNLCGGGLVRFQKGGTFSASLS